MQLRCLWATLRGGTRKASAQVLSKIAMAPGVSLVYLHAEASSLTRSDQLAHSSSARKKLIDTIEEVRTPSVRERVLERMTRIVDLARYADMARQASAALLLLALMATSAACSRTEGTTPFPITATQHPTASSSPTRVSSPPTATLEVIHPTEAKVVRVVDGDTIEVDIGGEAFQIRYIGIDSPELSEPFGAEATEANRQLVHNRTIRLVEDISGVDDFDRLLRYVYVGDMFVNAEMVRLGYARAVSYPPNVSHNDLFAEMERQAGQTGVGLWAGQPAGQIAVDPTCSRFDSPGNDGDSREQEYVCLRNVGPEPIDLTSYTLSDEYGWKYHFAAFTLDSGATVRVRSGCGDDRATDLYWCHEGASAIWNNDGDTVFLFSPEGHLLLEYSY